ncbi:MAG: LemA family protein [Deltaproteobacteria bacterium]|nr:LemA family protein [Deltaproteobacteria bacterium]
MQRRPLWITLGLLVVAVLYTTSTYNGFMQLEEDVKEAWGQVLNVYQRRADLIPNLVNTVKGYAAHEKETLTQVIEARAKATQIAPEALQNAFSNPQAFAQFEQAQAGLSSALSKLMVVVEKYPDLKANQNFLALQDQLEGTENRITVERQRFNEGVNTYNKTVRRVPGKFIASILGFTERPYFQATTGAENAPKVEF